MNEEMATEEEEEEEEGFFLLLKYENYQSHFTL